MKEREESKITAEFWFELLGRWCTIGCHGKKGAIRMYFERGEIEKISFEYFNFKLDIQMEVLRRWLHILFYSSAVRLEFGYINRGVTSIYIIFKTMTVSTNKEDKELKFETLQELEIGKR